MVTDGPLAASEDSGPATVMASSGAATASPIVGPASEKPTAGPASESSRQRPGGRLFTGPSVMDALPVIELVAVPESVSGRRVIAASATGANPPTEPVASQVMLPRVRESVPILGQVSSVTKTGDIVAIEGKDYVSEGGKRATVASALKFRSAPDVSAKTLLFQHGDSIQGPVGAKTDTLPAQTALALIARTKDKAKVQQWSNYWYYIAVSGAEIQYGWVYGEFVNLNP
jgi:hypothetical protein